MFDFMYLCKNQVKKNLQFLTVRCWSKNIQEGVHLDYDPF